MEETLLVYLPGKTLPADFLSGSASFPGYSSLEWFSIWPPLAYPLMGF